MLLGMVSGKLKNCALHTGDTMMLVVSQMLKSATAELVVPWLLLTEEYIKLELQSTRPVIKMMFGPGAAPLGITCE